jgi:pimeloyl-ACP methyl ester carboxylesterase
MAPGPGAWSGGNWPRLRKAGHEVYAPTLTGIGERKHLLSREIDLDTHIEDVIGVVENEDLLDIVLVGHSYGGMVISGVADRVPEKIACAASSAAAPSRACSAASRPAIASCTSASPACNWVSLCSVS